MNLMTSTGFGLGEPEAVFLAMIVGLVLTSYLIARYGAGQGKSFWQVFGLSLIAGPVVGAIVASVPGAAAPEGRTGLLRP